MMKKAKDNKGGGIRIRLIARETEGKDTDDTKKTKQRKR